jgi:methylenetetrahydrofolate--tRNA-(uracil-5-)-methyltransferase
LSADSLDRSIVFEASRWDKGDGADYLNCPMDKAQYEALVAFLCQAECMPAHAFEKPKYFQGCLPIEVMAQGGPETLRFGPLKPVGLTDPRTGRWPYAVVQLRAEDRARQAYNLVGMQTKLKYPEQRKLLQLIPGLADAEVLRYGAMHRNTYLDSPALLDARLRLRSQPNLRFAGQITGVEGYVESAACGLLAALLVQGEATGQEAPPPETTALGALLGHVLGVHRIGGRPHEPQNVNWAMFPEMPGTKTGRKGRPVARARRVERAQDALEDWAAQCGRTLKNRAVPETPKEVLPPKTQTTTEKESVEVQKAV